MLLAGGGLALGALALAAPVRTARLFGFPASHVNATTVAMGRLYAIREAARGVQLVHEARSARGPQAPTAAVNLAIDATDAVMFTTLAATRPEIRRASVSIALFASAVSARWLRYLLRVRAARS